MNPPPSQKPALWRRPELKPLYVALSIALLAVLVLPFVLAGFLFAAGLLRALPHRRSRVAFGLLIGVPHLCCWGLMILMLWLSGMYDIKLHPFHRDVVGVLGVFGLAGAVLSWIAFYISHLITYRILIAIVGALALWLIIANLPALSYMLFMSPEMFLLAGFLGFLVFLMLKDQTDYAGLPRPRLPVVKSLLWTILAGVLPALVFPLYWLVECSFWPPTDNWNQFCVWDAKPFRLFEHLYWIPLWVFAWYGGVGMALFRAGTAGTEPASKVRKS